MKTINIKGKEYVTVNERVKYFREKFPDHQIETFLESDVEGRALFRAVIRNGNGDIVSSGYAMEKEGSTFINKTSHYENAETSAVGRALGFLGVGIDASIATANEVGNAVNNQKKEAENFPPGF